MSGHELVAALLEASKDASGKVGLYEADLTNISRAHKAKFTTIRLLVKSTDLTPNDAFDGGLVAYVVLAPRAEAQRALDSNGKPEGNKDAD